MKVGNTLRNICKFKNGGGGVILKISESILVVKKVKKHFKKFGCIYTRRNYWTAKFRTIIQLKMHKIELKV